MLQHKETAKTIALTLLVGLVAGFIAGAHYEHSNSKAVQAAAKTLVQPVQAAK